MPKASQRVNIEVDVATELRHPHIINTLAYGSRTIDLTSSVGQVQRRHSADATAHFWHRCCTAVSGALQSPAKAGA